MPSQTICENPYVLKNPDPSTYFVFFGGFSDFYGSKTPFSKIRRVLPGETIVTRAGRIIERHKIAALPGLGVSNISDAKAITGLDTILSDSINFHQRADVPYGMFLSGGSDSSVLISVMRRLNSHDDRLDEGPVDGVVLGSEGERVVCTPRGFKHPTCQLILILPKNSTI